MSTNAMIERWLVHGRIPGRYALGALDLTASGCLDCHTYQTAGRQSLGAPDLTSVGRQNSQSRLAKAIRCPTCVHPGSAMPAFPRLQRGTVEELAAFLSASR